MLFCLNNDKNEKKKKIFINKEVGREGEGEINSMISFIKLTSIKNSITETWNGEPWLTEKPTKQQIS